MNKEWTIEEIDEQIKRLNKEKQLIKSRGNLNTALFYGFFFGILASTWATMLYQEIIKDLWGGWRGMIFLLLSFLLVFFMIIFMKEFKFTKNSLQKKISQALRGY